MDFEKKQDLLCSGKYYDFVQMQFDVIWDYIKRCDIKDNSAIIFDIDEVCLCNIMYECNEFKELHVFFSEKYGNEFTFDSNYNPLIPVFLKFYKELLEMKLNIFFITGRKEIFRDLTISNLDKVDINRYCGIYFRPNDEENVVSFKSQCRKQIYELGYTILACVGDQISDLVGNNTGQCFLIYNPYYKI